MLVEQNKTAIPTNLIGRSKETNTSLLLRSVILFCGISKAPHNKNERIFGLVCVEHGVYSEFCLTTLILLVSLIVLRTCILYYLRTGN